MKGFEMKQNKCMADGMQRWEKLHNLSRGKSETHEISRYLGGYVRWTRANLTQHVTRINLTLNCLQWYQATSIFQWPLERSGHVQGV